MEELFSNLDPTMQKQLGLMIQSLTPEMLQKIVPMITQIAAGAEGGCIASGGCIDLNGSVDDSVDKLTQQLERMMDAYETAQERKGKKLVSPPPRDLFIAGFRAERQKTLQESREPFRILQSNVFDVYHSTVRDLSSLSLIAIDDLLLETWHQGRYLLLRTIELPYRLNGVMTIVEDHRGQVGLLALYNFTKQIDDPPERYLPVNSVLLIKEPYYKLSTGSNAMIRCDSPTDVVFIRYGDENYRRLKGSMAKKWDGQLAKDDRVWSPPRPSNPMEWKERGNALYKSGHLEDAVRAYSIGLKEVTNVKAGKDLASVLQLNRSAAYFEQGRYDDSARDAQSVLGADPLNVKALSRAARSFYRLRDFPSAWKHFERLQSLAAKDQSISRLHGVDIEMCRQRLVEQTTGRYDWPALEKIFEAPRPTGAAVRFDVADYFNADCLEIVEQISPGKGRGVRAKRDIRPGTLLSLEKAFVSCFNSEIPKNVHLVHIYLKRKSMETDTQVPLLTAAIHRLMECPSLGRRFYRLWGGRGLARLADDQAIDRMAGIIDFDRVHQTCYHNTFGVQQHQKVSDDSAKDGDKNPHKEEEEEAVSPYPDGGCGIWINNSSFNHSCVPNAFYRFMGDVQVVVSSRYIHAGCEVTLGYVPATIDYEKRREVTEKLGFTCQCALCLQDSACDLQRVEEAAAHFHTKLSPRAGEHDTRVIRPLERHIASVRKLYGKDSRFRISLVHPFLALAHLFDARGMPGERAKALREAIACLSNIRDVDAYLSGQMPPGEPVYLSQDLPHMLGTLVECYRRMNDTKRACRWARLLLLVDGVVCGNSLDETRSIYGSVLYGLPLNDQSVLHDNRIA